MPVAPARKLFAVFLGVIVMEGCGGDGPTENPLPVAITISPTSATLNGGGTQEFTATVTNGSSQDVTWTSSGGNLSGNGNSRTFTAPATGGPFTVTATSVADPTKSASATVTLRAVTVSVAPATATVSAGGTQEFTATVGNASNTAVTWSSTGGTIAGTGSTVVWTAPAGGGPFTITATSVADPTKSGSATATVTAASVAITPATQTVFRGQPVTLTAAVTGAAVTTVTWSATCGVVTGTALTVTWTAPDAGGDCVVTAASTVDPTKTGTATLTVRPDLRVAATDDVDDGACTFAHCSLREAINRANANPDVDSIRFAAAAGASVFGRHAASMQVGTLLLTSALPKITTPIHFIGTGVSSTTIDANATQQNMRRVFEFEGNFTGSVRDMTLTGGVSSGHGGAISISGKSNIALTNLVITDNETREADGGGVAVNDAQAQLTNVTIDENRTFGTNRPAGGLSISNASVVTMTGGSVSDNTVENGWGGGVRVLSASLTMNNVTVDGNETSGAGGGGGILAEGATTVLNMTQVTVTDNSTPAGGGGVRALSGATVTITNSTISGNTALSGGGLEGGNLTMLTMNGSTIANNTGSNQAGGIWLWGTTEASIGTTNITDNTGTTQGGGLLLSNTKPTTLTTVNVRDNKTNTTTGSLGGGAGIIAFVGTTLVVSGGEIAENEALGQGAGAGIFTFGSLQLQNVTVRNNVARGPFIGGGIFAQDAAITITGGSIRDNQSAGRIPSGNDAGALGPAGGLGLRGTTLATITGTQITGNTATGFGGGLYVAGTAAVTLANVTVNNNTASSNGGGGIYQDEGAVLTVNNGELANNAATGGASAFDDFGGGIHRLAGSYGALTFTGTRIANNTAATQGGGLHINGTGAVQLNRVTVSGNTSSTGGGGATFGQASFLVDNSTFSGNSTGAAATGGGIFSASTATTTIRNSTFSGNSAFLGGGVGATGSITILNSTFVANTATNFGGGIGVNNNGVLNIRNSLFSANTVNGGNGNCGTGGAGAFNSQGNNLSDQPCATLTGPNDKNNTPAGINATLANNGGPTFTHALLDGSAAINAANAASCTTTDQRGAPRVGTCDIGAFEFGATAPAVAGFRTNSRTPLKPRGSATSVKSAGTNGKASRDPVPPIMR